MCKQGIPPLLEPKSAYPGVTTGLHVAALRRVLFGHPLPQRLDFIAFTGQTFDFHAQYGMRHGGSFP